MSEPEGCTRASINDELEKTIERLKHVRFDISGLLDRIDGPSPQESGEQIPKGPTVGSDAGLHNLRLLLTDLNHVISQVEQERDRLAIIQETLMGPVVSAPVECLQSREVRPGNWGSHP